MAGDLDDSRNEIERRFVYYSRLATVGTLAHMLVHEVMSRTTVIGALLNHLERDPNKSQLAAGVLSGISRAHDAIVNLERLAETFLPLASRDFSRRKTTSILEDRISGVLMMLSRDIAHGGIRVDFKEGASTPVAADAAEVDAILFNLIGNAVYWLTASRLDEKRIQIHVRRNRPAGRVTITIDDSGPGVPEESRAEIFWPGVTRKPGGIGMGLTIAAEIVSAYDGKLGVAESERLSGASFEFDLPMLHS